jgi:hypothetical protein
MRLFGSTISVHVVMMCKSYPFTEDLNAGFVKKDF